MFSCLSTGAGGGGGGGAGAEGGNDCEYACTVYGELLPAQHDREALTRAEKMG